MTAGRLLLLLIVVGVGVWLFQSRVSGPATPAGAVTENMTPEQVRALLGPPDDVSSEESASGASRERWTYRKAGKSVVFENGVAIRVE